MRELCVCLFVSEWMRQHMRMSVLTNEYERWKRMKDLCVCVGMQERWVEEERTSKRKYFFLKPVYHFQGKHL